MRIALAHKLYRLTGGAEVFFRETERVLREQGHETLMIATGDADEVEAPTNLLLLQAPAYDSPSTLTKIKNLPAAIYDLQKKHVVKQALAEFKPDIFHAFAVNVHLSPSVITAASELGIPVVGTFNDYKHICPNYKLFHHDRICMDCIGGKFYSASINKCCKDSSTQSVAAMFEAYAHGWMGIYDKFSHFTFSSDFMAEVTQKFWPKRSVSWSKLRNPFDSRKYAALDEYGNYGLYFGRLIDEKGVDRLVQAASKIDGFPIKIIGDGPDLPKLRTMTESLGLTNVEFLGPMWGAALDAVLCKARFVVVPSIWHENFPYVINQAFAYGRPVIGAARGGIPELVQHGERGLIFEPDNIDQLADSIRQLVTSDDLVERMGKAAKSWSDSLFRDDVAYTDLMQAYEAAADENHRRRR
jgi:glycosyltransferase involved in cell wall biosynthesis